MAGQDHHAPTIVEEGMEIRYGGRRGTVFLVRSDSADILWHEHVDTETGEVLPRGAGCLKHAEIRSADLGGRFRVLSRPAVPGGPPFGRLPTVEELRRRLWRLSFVEAAQKLIDTEGMGTTRRAFIDSGDRILADGQKLYVDKLQEQAGQQGARGGKRLNNVELRSPPKSAATVHGWWIIVQRGGADRLLDHYRRSGNRGERYPPDVVALATAVVDARLDEERPTIANIWESVQSAFHVENKRRLSQPIPEGVLTTPGYDYIHDLVDRRAPVDHKIRTRGMKSAYADLHTLGLGLDATRPMQRVLIDEYDVDAMVFLRDDTRLLEHLPDGLVDGFGLNGEPVRLRVSAAIDAYTRCILAMKFTVSRRGVMLAETLEMIMSDKGEFADGVGELSRWFQCGRPELICLDRDPGYAGDETAALLSSLGITNFGPPSRKPWLRALIERFFRTYHQRFINRLSGRTFGSVGAKGDNDPAARASVTFDQFLMWTVRWLLEIYHLTPHPGLAKLTPAQKWAEATAVHKVNVPSHSEMRLVFGTREMRKLLRRGIRVMHIDYQSDELVSEFLGKPRRRPDVPLEVAWWPGDIGAVEVRISDDEWLTVPAADPFWRGKTLNDLIILQAKGRELDKTLEDIRMQAIHDLDQFSLQRKALLGLLPSRVETPAQLRRLEQHFSRFMVTAERLSRAPEPRDLYDDEVLPADEKPVHRPDPARHDGPHPSPAADLRPNPDDIME